MSCLSFNAANEIASASSGSFGSGCRSSSITYAPLAVRCSTRFQLAPFASSSAATCASGNGCSSGQRIAPHRVALGLD
jgi:hypothetical protein